VNLIGLRGVCDEAARAEADDGPSQPQGVNTAIARFNTFGLRMRRNDGRAPCVSAPGNRGKPLTVFGDGSRIRSATSTISTTGLYLLAMTSICR
jgi:hypothetical protein